MPTTPRAALPARTPLATYRLQLNLDFTFDDATRIVPYLDALGVSDLYSSPFLQARAGSVHGYDISDHGTLNPELGGLDAHERLTTALRRHEMGCLVDIVPNHMGIGETANSWWMDVLENGQSSPFAPYFDIDWRPLKPELAGKVLLPVLGDQFGRILEKGELRLQFAEGYFRILYYEHVFPVSPRSSSLVLRAILVEMRKEREEDADDVIELESIVNALEHIPPRDRTDEASIAERRRESFVSRRRLRELHASSPAFREALVTALEAHNGRVGDPQSFDALERVLEDQPYRLAYWRVAVEEINYRRFFDVNDLAGVRVEKVEVFEATHRLVLQLVASGAVTGLRIDHPDGLFNPSDYLRSLQEQASQRADEHSVYIAVEKILTGNEPLSERWPVAGTVGYDFLNRLNGLFVAAENEAAMTRIYRAFSGDGVAFSQLAYQKKKLILRVALASELNVLAYLLDRISEKNRRYRDFTLGSLTDALRETIACFPVYRTYIDAVRGSVDELDVAHIDKAVRAAIRRNRATSPTVFEFIRDTLLLHWPEELDEEAREEHALFVMKFQQLTGPVMAKGVEDTAFYIYHRLTSLNEVGGEPDHFGISPERFHAWLLERASTWPGAMNTTTTHDTKRSEDVRARINVLSEIPDEWEERVRHWADLNAASRTLVDGELVPGANEEYLLYQTLVGAWPLEDSEPEEMDDFRSRIQQYIEKATREAKVETSWITPNEAYDDALRDFVGRILEPATRTESDPFTDDLRTFARDISHHGMLNSLAQTLIKLCAPGVPDIYQGQETWDFSLVDPDNRRPVDFEFRRRMLETISVDLEAAQRRERAAELTREWQDGRIKMYVHHVALAARRGAPALFQLGDYLPLEVEGERATHVFAFARRRGVETIIVVVPRLTRMLSTATGRSISDPEAWGDTRILLDGLPSNRFINLFTGRMTDVADGRGRALHLAESLAEFPVALLRPA